MTQLTSRSTIKPSPAVNQPLVKIRANENTMAQSLISVNKEGAVSYRIGETPWRSSSQPTPFITF